jgi:hypothetical protein
MAVIAATAAIRGVADSVIDRGPAGVHCDGVYVRQDDVRTGGVLLVIEVVAVQTERNGMPWVQRFDHVVGDFAVVHDNKYLVESDMKHLFQISFINLGHFKANYLFRVTRFTSTQHCNISRLVPRP